MDIHFLAAVAGAYLLAGFVKGVIGMGLPTVSVGLLGLLVTPAQAAAIMVVPSFATNVWQGLAGGELRALLRRLWPMLAGVWAGIALGALVLPRADSVEATVGLGLALAAYAALGLFNVHFSVSRRAEGWVGVLIGVATGAISVSTGVFAMPMTPYIQALGLERDRLVQALGLSFTAATVALALALAYTGDLKLSLAWPALLALVAALVGMPIGQFVRARISPATFRLCFYIALLLLGTRLALRGLI